MKYLFILVSIIVLLQSTLAQNVGINATNAIPDASAMLDVNSTNTGLLIPRITLTGTTDVTTITAAATSLLVYNTATVSDVTPGYYYWDGTTWLRMINTGNSSGGDWALTGNAGTTVGTNFLGTTDAQDLAIYTNNAEVVRVTQNGDVGIGTTTPGEQLTIGANNFVFHNGGDKAIGFNTDWTPTNSWTKITGSNYQGRIHFNPATGDLGFISSDSLTNLNNLDDNRIFIQGGTGSVGVGTTTPSAKLHAVLAANTSASHVFGITRQGTGAAGNGVFFTHGASANDYNAITDAGDIGMFFDIDGNPAVSTSTNGLVIAPWANGGIPGSGSGIKIQENGNVGIGTTAPSATLDVYNYNTIGVRCKNFSTIAGTATFRLDRNDLTTSNNIVFGSPSYEWSSGQPIGTRDFVISRNPSINTGSQFRIQYTTGNVGIGTTAPTRNLHITDPTAPILKLEEVDAATEWDLVADGTSFSIRRNNLYTEPYPFNIKINKNIGLSTINPTAVLSVNGSANKTGGGAWAVFSDRTLKKDISEFSLGLETLSKVHAINFKYNDKYFDIFGESEIVRKSTYQGVIAQELQKIAPFMVESKTVEILDNKGNVTKTEKVLEVDPSAFTYMLINATNEQQQIIEMQQKEINNLKKEIEIIKQMVLESKK